MARCSDGSWYTDGARKGGWPASSASRPCFLLGNAGLGHFHSLPGVSEAQLVALVHMTHCASSRGGNMVLLPVPGKKLAPPRNRFLRCFFFDAGERPSPGSRLEDILGRLV